jgi:hypothetical protein
LRTWCSWSDSANPQLLRRPGPEAAPFFASETPVGSQVGDGVDGSDEGEMAAALASIGLRASRVGILFTAASMVGAVNSILGGVGIALLVQRVAGIGSAGTVLIGVAAALVVFGWHLVWERRLGTAATVGGFTR